MVFERNKSLRELSNYKIGGPADYFFAPKTIDELIEALRFWDNKGKLFIIGGATNLLISDEGFRGLVVKPDFTWIDVQGDTIRVGAGALMKEVVAHTVTHGLSGFEWAGGLPGTVGGAIRGNAGAFGGETKDAVVEVRSVTIGAAKPEVVVRRNAECKFGYRNSVYKEKNGEEIIVEAVFRLKPGDATAIARAVNEKINYRTTRHPIDLPNVGSIFKNIDVAMVSEPVRKQFEKVIKQDPFLVIPVACLISEAGLKGVREGGAMISPKHPNFIVNTGNATARNVKTLIAIVKRTIQEKFGVILEEEVIYL